MRVAFILLCLLLGSCSMTRQVSKEKDFTSISHADSVFSHTHVTDQGSFEQTVNHVYDSIITHVTIIRYDTIVSISGEPAIKERIQIEQVQIKKNEAQASSGDSLHISSQTSSEVNTDNYTNDKEITKEKAKKRPKLTDICIVCLIVVLIVELVFIGYKVLRHE